MESSSLKPIIFFKIIFIKVLSMMIYYYFKIFGNTTPDYKANVTSRIYYLNFIYKFRYNFKKVNFYT